MIEDDVADVHGQRIGDARCCGVQTLRLKLEHAAGGQDTAQVDVQSPLVGRLRGFEGQFVGSHWSSTNRSAGPDRA
jgi:hypothetical protein